MNDMLDILIDIFPEFGLPEPETSHVVSTAAIELNFLFAWPNHKIGIRQGNNEPQTIENWNILECYNLETARLALRKVGDLLNIESNILRVDFNKVQALFDAGQYEYAKREVEQSIEKLQPDHPDYANCNKWIKDLRKAIKKNAPEIIKPVEIPKTSLPEQIRKDAERVQSVLFKPFNILGIYSPKGSNFESVDAVWLGIVREGKVEPFAACVENSPAYEDDSNWQVFGSELDLLEELIEKLNNQVTFIWGTEKILPLINQWHYRLKGQIFDSVKFYDLEKLSNVFFPLTHRTDFPDSFCKQKGITFADEMGLGGPLAAEISIINTCIEFSNELSDELRFALKEILKGKAKIKENKLFIDSSDNFYSDWISDEWLDVFFPSNQNHEPVAAIKLIKSYHERLAPVLITSSEKEGNNFEKYITLDILKNGGVLSILSSFGYAERKEQIAFSQKIEECMNSSNSYVLEAGTGIGKTIGYLVPALLSKNKTFIATHTKSLQDQAWFKDIPIVFEALSHIGLKKTATIIKGKSNYVCLQSFADILDSFDEYIESPNDGYYLASILHWLLITETGWLSEVEHLGNWKLSRLLSRDMAPPSLRGEWSDIDPHNKAKVLASKADLVVANHSYVVLISQSSGQNNEGTDTLIVDEAHNIENVVTEVLTKHFKPFELQGELNSLLKRDKNDKIQGLLRPLTEHKEKESNELIKAFNEGLFEYETALNSWCGNALKRLIDLLTNITDADPDYPIPFELSDFWIPSLFDDAKLLSEVISKLANKTRNLIEAFQTLSGIPAKLHGSLGSFEQRLNENNTGLSDLFEKKNDWVHWGEAVAKGNTNDSKDFNWIFILHSTPIDIAGWLRTNFHPKFKHEAFVSATLTVAGSFDPLCTRLGLDSSDINTAPVTGIFPSPFDYKKQALLAVPHDMPLADSKLKIDPYYIEEQAKHIAKQAIVSDGRMLVLFTSNLIMTEIQPRLQAWLNDSGISVISQKDGNRSALVDRLRDAPRKGEKIVLLGVRSFWEGVDIQGAALSSLVVTRLPFEYHNHPVQIAKKKFYEAGGHDRDYFAEYVVPATFIHLRQMYGRLIRSEKDYGATIITDPRIYTKRYGKSLLHSLPETTTVIDKGDIVVDVVRKFLAGEAIESSYVWGGLPYASYELSPEQRSIVDSPSKRILVRAAAGSGKTHVLIKRLIRLVLNHNAKPEEVLALTFTNKAMNVMYERIENELGGDKAYAMHRNILTYHKLAMRIIRQDDMEKEQETNFLDEKNPALQLEFIEKARQKAGINKNTLNDEDALTLIGYAQNGLINESELEGKIDALKAIAPLMAKFAVFYLTYVSLLRENNVIDYGEAIVKAINILRENKDQAQRWSNRFKWIFCDEYQDTSPAQATLLQLLGQQANLFVVGDSYQSIYSWQGSDPDNLRRFEVDFPNTASYYLSKNYRCFPKLVRMSQGFLERAGEQQGLRVEYDHKRSTEDQSVYFLSNENDTLEAETVTAVIKTALALEIPGDPPKKATVGILARKWHLLSTIERALLKNGIPYKFEGDTARGLLASTRIRKIVEQAANLLLRIESSQEFGDSAEGRIGQKIKNNTINFAGVLLKEIASIQTDVGFSGIEKTEFDDLCEMLNEEPIGNLKPFNTGDNGNTCVVLSTIHSQKGEEFDTVLVVGMEEGNSPHEQPKSHGHLIEWRKVAQGLSHATWRASITNQDLERIYTQEEKRIFYVAMTRAKYHLVISNSKNRNLFGNAKTYEKSSFLGLSHDINLVKEANSIYEIEINSPKIDISDKGYYRSDGRVFQTNNGELVRSKSEMLIANEFFRLGIKYEYELPDDNIPNALPDFVLPEYSNVIIEHLGLLTDEEYQRRWNEKAKQYEAEGKLYLCTNEAEMKYLTTTIERLLDQSRLWCETKFGKEKLLIIKKLEEERRKNMNV